MRKQPPVLLLTGKPGVGKTTLIGIVAEHYGFENIAGFVTEEIREHGQRKGFVLKSFQGDEEVLAHVDFHYRHRVGKYSVNVASIDRFANSALQALAGKKLVLIDEIGKMECFSLIFIERVRSLLQSGITVVATVALSGSGFIEEVKQWPGIRLMEMTRQNRNEMALRIITWIDARISAMQTQP